MSEPTFAHTPVLLAEVIEALGSVPPGWVVDATVGGGGHAEALLANHPHLSVAGLDRDPLAVHAAAARLAPFGERARVHHLAFDALPDLMESSPLHLTGVLFDLGLSSPQLDVAERGFSYRADGPLDMRMDPTVGEPAEALVNDADAAELASVIRRHGDERFAGRIAAAIVAARPISGTAQLAEVVRDAIPAAARRSGGHPASRTFQALRMAVNDEVGQLERALDAALALLVEGGRCAAITYHSGEDRIVAGRLRDEAARGSVALVPRRAIRPSAAEIATNPRSRSARLRVAEVLR